MSFSELAFLKLAPRRGKLSRKQNTDSCEHAPVFQHAPTPSGPRRPIKESQFGSLEQVKKINNCSHKWEVYKVSFWGYMEANFRCQKCKTKKR